jgi:hypothetical protein
MKVLTVIVNGENCLIKYGKSRSKKGEMVFSVETTIASADRFTFWIEGRQAVYVKTGNPRDSIIEQIIPQIGKEDAKN